jgi:hypothetical protein
MAEIHRSFIDANRVRRALDTKAQAALPGGADRR